MFLDEQFMGRVWEEANKRLAAEQPDIEKEIEANFAEAAKVQASIDRYFKAFEDGKLNPGLCNEKVRICGGGWRNWRHSGWISMPADRGWTYPRSTARCSRRSSTSSKR